MTHQGNDPKTFAKGLGKSLASEEARYAYADSVTNAFVAAQIKALREERELSQDELAGLIGTKQSGISRLERADYSSWKVETLRKLARAFKVRLRIRFEGFGTLLDEVSGFNDKNLLPPKFEDDPVFKEEEQAEERLATSALAQYEAALSPDYSLSQLVWGGSESRGEQYGQYGVPEPEKDPENIPPVSNQVTFDAVSDVSKTMPSSGHLKQHDIHAQGSASGYKGMRLIPNKPAQQTQTALNPPNEVSAQALRVA